MRITDIRETTVPLSNAIRNASIGFDEMTASAVAIVTDAVRDGRPVVGYGFSSIGRYGHGGLLRERFIPRLAAVTPSDLLDENGTLDPFKAWAVLMRNEKPGGHGERSGAVGVLDMAVWDIVAKIEGKPLWRLLADRFNGGQADERVFVYASGGHYHPGGDLRALQDEVQTCLDLGYATIKIKAGAAGLDDDRRRIDAVKTVLGPEDRLAIDVNCAFGPGAAEEYARALSAYDLAWIEEICDPLDFETQAAVCAAYDGPLATGENLFSLADARNLLRYGGLRPDRDILQFDIPLSYGLVEYLRILDVLDGMGWSRRRCIPHAGYLFAAGVAAGLGLGGHETAPAAAGPFGGLWDGVSVTDGFFEPQDIPGVGFEGKSDFYALLRRLAP